MIDRAINKKTPREISGISATFIAKLGNGGNDNTEILLRICTALKCDVGDIMEIVPDGAKREKDVNTNMLMGGLQNED